MAAVAVWRAYGVDELLNELWRKGVILTGWSAGAVCWFAASLTASLVTDQLEPYHDGLGIIPDSACPHFNGTERRDAFARCVAAGTLPPGFGFDEGSIGHFVGPELAQVLSTNGIHSVHHVTPDGISRVAADPWP